MKLASFIKVPFIGEWSFQQGGGIFRIFLGKEWRFLRGDLWAILCPYMGFMFQIIISFSMLMYYNEQIMKQGSPSDEISCHVGCSWSLPVLSHKSGGRWGGTSFFFTVSVAFINCSCSDTSPLSVAPSYFVHLPMLHGKVRVVFLHRE
uniref:Uncharacterized protein n=1 Tax=Myotis myotis TaxID=51298 RepID=A0A7J7VYN7_MYOMY|nr:hypothetical protein mMyoMyo1_012327 [Myotis myotis]